MITAAATKTAEKLFMSSSAKAPPPKGESLNGLGQEHTIVYG